MEEDTELVPAWLFYQTKKRSNNTSVYQHIRDCFESFGIEGVETFLDRMIVLDYIIANEDRHLNNFGALRNAETLQWLGMAPIYDSGTALGYDKLPEHILSEQGIGCKPFKNHHAEQLKLATSFDWIDFGRLSDVGGMIEKVLTAGEAKDFIEGKRVQVVIRSVQRRIGNLTRLAQTHTLPRKLSTEDDVEKNIAEDYTSRRRR